MTAHDLTAHDLPRIAAAVAELGQVLGTTTAVPGYTRPISVAEAALLAARSYQPGARAAALQPSRSRRLEDVRWPEGTTELVEIPSDPVGEAAVADDRTLGYPDELLALMASLDRDAARARRLIDILLPPQPNTRPGRCSDCGAPRLVHSGAPKREQADQLVVDGWCPSCYRDDHYLKLIDTDPRGNRYYKDRCRWCGGFRARHKLDPPLVVIEAHHIGRVSRELVARALREARRNQDTDTPTKGKKKRKKGHAA